MPEENAHIYVCGPKRLIEDVIAVANEKGWTKEHLHFELFGNPSAKQDDDQPIEVTLNKTGKTIQVAAGQSILDALLEENIAVDFSCKRGECATCKVPVLEGDIDHRDIVLDSYEKEAGNVMCSCVSRVKGDKLALDL